MNLHLIESAEFYERRYHNFSTLLIFPLSLLVIFALGFLLFAKKEMALTSQARVEPRRILETIQSTSSQKILVNHLEEDKLVQKGDLLLSYDQTDAEVTEKSIEEELAALRDQKSQLELLKKSLETGQDQFPQADEYGYQASFLDYMSQRASLTSQVNQGNETIANHNAKALASQNELASALSTTSRKLEAYRDLKTALETGIALPQGHSLYQLYQNYQTAGTSSQEALKEVEGQIAQLEASQSSYQIQYAGSGALESSSTSLSSQLSSLQSQQLTKVGQEMTTLNQSIRSLEGKLAQGEVLLDKGKIIAPQTGILHVDPQALGSQMLAEGSLLAQLYPDLKTEKRVKLVSYVSSKDIAAVHKGMGLRFSILDASKKSWTFRTKISQIADTPTSTKEGNLYKIEAELDLTDKEAKILKYGQEGKLVLVTGEKTYLAYYWDRFLYAK